MTDPIIPTNPRVSAALDAVERYGKNARFTPSQRRFALRMTTNAARLAEQAGNPMLNQSILWRLMVAASHQHRTKKKGR
jgi:hypothetical protein